MKTALLCLALLALPSLPAAHAQTPPSPLEGGWSCTGAAGRPTAEMFWSASSSGYWQRGTQIAELRGQAEGDTLNAMLLGSPFGAVRLTLDAKSQTLLGAWLRGPQREDLRCTRSSETLLPDFPRGRQQPYRAPHPERD